MVKGVMLLLETFGTSDCFRVSIAWFVFSFLRGFSGVTRGVIFGSLSEDFDCFTAVTGGVLLLDFKLVLVLVFFLCCRCCHDVQILWSCLYLLRLILICGQRDRDER